MQGGAGDFLAAGLSCAKSPQGCGSATLKETPPRKACRPVEEDLQEEPAQLGLAVPPEFSLQSFPNDSYLKVQSVTRHPPE
jgi:hypothetical protein